MLLEAVYHRPKLNWAYAYDEQTIQLRLRTKRDDVKKVFALVGDKYAWDRTADTVSMVKWMSDTMFDYWQIAVVPPFRRLRYGFMLQSGKDIIWMTEKGFQPDKPVDANALFDFPFINPADVFAPPEWVKEAVFYQIFPERFANGDTSNDPDNIEPWGGMPTPKNFFGGDLQGVIDHLDHLTELGINAIYFNPLFEASTNHKYDTKDYLKVDPHFGTNEKLKELVDLCHERGIRVVLDAVFNHSGSQFPPFVDVLEKGAASPYAEWFHVREFPLEVRDNIPTYDTFGFEPIMPKLNTEHPEVIKYLLEVARYWVEEIGIDGWRLDVANEVDHQFWRAFRNVVKQVNPDAYILGEIFHDSLMWLQGDQFDAVMNYPFTGVVLDFVAKQQIDGAGFANAIGAQLASYPQQVNEVAFNLLGSHDTERLLTACGSDKRLMKLATLLQFSFAGTPCVYYGDEIGLDGEHDPGCRKCMEWDESKQDRDLFGYFQQIIALRKQHKALQTGELRFLYAKPDDMALAFERKNENEHFVIVVNVGKRPRTIGLSLEESHWTDTLTGEQLTADKGKLSIKLPAYGYRVLQAIES
jgi:glycosidase